MGECYSEINLSRIMSGTPSACCGSTGGFTRVILPSGVFLIISIFLSSCAGLHLSSVAERGGKAGDDDAIIITGVPFYQQEDYQCGPASLAAVMNYWGARISRDEVAEDIFSISAEGTLTLDMVLYPRKKGLDTAHYSGGLDDLRRNIDLGNPLVVLVDYGFFLYQANHFMVVIGYNDKGVIVNSGKEEKKFITTDDFLKLWKRTRFWTLLIKHT